MRRNEEWDRYDESLDKKRETIKADQAAQDHYQRIDDRRTDDARKTERRRLVAQGAAINAENERPTPRPKLDPRAVAAERRKRFARLRRLWARRGGGIRFSKPPKLRDMLLVIGGALAVVIGSLMGAFKRAAGGALTYVPRIGSSSATLAPPRRVEIEFPNPTHSGPKPKPKPVRRTGDDPAPPVHAAMAKGTTVRLTPEQEEKARIDKWNIREAKEEARYKYGNDRILDAVAEALTPGRRLSATFHQPVLSAVDTDLKDFFYGRHDMQELRAAQEAFTEFQKTPGIDDRYIAEKMLPKLLQNARQYGALLRAQETADAAPAAGPDAPTPTEGNEPEQKPAPKADHTLDPWKIKP